jgi:hypothetical protein
MSQKLNHINGHFAKKSETFISKETVKGYSFPEIIDHDPTGTIKLDYFKK